MIELCAIAVETIRAALVRERPAPPDLAGLPPALGEHGASFVTLEREGRLLGCVGTLEAVRPLAYDVALHAIGAAFNDPRVPPVTTDDFGPMAVKVSVLSRLRPLPVASRDELATSLRPRVDGLLIEAGARRATFLPSVWAKVPDTATFLDELWRKAGLARGAWPVEIECSIYTAVEYTDPGPRAFSTTPA